MRICVYDNAEQAGRAAAMLLAAQLIRKADSVLGLATGSSPIPAYRELIQLNKTGVIDFSQARTYNLDEYVGIPEDHPCSYHRFMREQLFAHVNIDPANTHVPDGNAPDLVAMARAYDKAIEQAGQIDIQVLGIGRNGHIGFNEPSDRFIENCHVVTLSENTIDANKRFFSSADEVPRQAVSLGIGAIMNARQVLLIASGKSKAQAIHDTVYGDVNPLVQASILHMHHEVTLLLDRDAASLL